MQIKSQNLLQSCDFSTSDSAVANRQIVSGMAKGATIILLTSPIVGRRNAADWRIRQVSWLFLIF